MSNYRPITDFWILGRCKHGYYGGYPAGFLERARPLLLAGDNYWSPLWHIPGGKAKDYNGVHGGITLSAFGPNDVTIDLDPECEPTVLADVRHLGDEKLWKVSTSGSIRYKTYRLDRPQAILIDRPYTEADAEHYAPGAAKLPALNKLVTDCARFLQRGSRLGVIDYQWPAPPNDLLKPLAVVCVAMGRNSRARLFSVWIKL